MLSFKEMMYVVAIATVCFLACVFKTAFLWRGGYGGLVNIYIFSTFVLFIGAFLMFLLLSKKCREYEQNRERDTFLAAKKLKNISEIVYVTVFIFFVACFFDISNGVFVGSIYKDIAVLFTSYPFYEILAGLAALIYGLKVIFYFFETNKLYSIAEAESFKQTPKSVYEVTKQYPTFEEYEKGMVSRPVNAAHTAVRTENADQERFLREHEVPIEDIDRRLAGLDAGGIRNGKTVYSNYKKTDLASTDPGDNSLSVCPLCGSLNRAESGECSFCGSKLGQL